MFEIHLLHPKVVHFTIGIFGAAVFLEILAALLKKTSLKQAATWNLYLAALFAAASVITGLLAASRVPHNDRAHAIMETHETLGYIILGTIVVLALWRLFLANRLPAKFALWHLLLAVIGFGLVVYSGYLGGEMVYTYGVGVAPVSTALQSQSHEHNDGAVHDHDAAQPQEEAKDEISEKGVMPEPVQEEMHAESSHEHDHSGHQH